MKRFLRIIGAILLLLIITIIALPFLFKGRIQGEIQNLANENLNAELSFDDVSLSLISNFPNLSVDVEGLQISGIDSFQGVNLVKLEDLEATVDLMSLMGDEIKIKHISLVSPEIHVIVKANGEANYDIAKPSEESDASETSNEESGAFALNLEGYSISNGYIIYEDATMPIRTEIVDLNHDGSGDFTESLFVLNTETKMESLDLVYDGAHYINRAAVDLKADLEIDNANSKYTFKDNQLLFNALALNADGWISMPGDDIEMDLRFQSADTDILHLLSMVPAEFAQDLNGVSASGTMDLNGFVRGIYNEETLPGFAANLKVDNGRFNYPDMPKGVENINIDVHVDASNGIEDDRMTIDVDRFYLEMANNPVDLELHLRNPYTDPDIDAKVQAKVVFASLQEVIPLDEGDQLDGSINANVGMKGRLSAIEEERFEDFDAQGEIVLLDLLYSSDSIPYDVDIRSAYLDFSPRFASLNNFKAVIGKTDLQANGRITDYLNYALRDSMLTGSFNVSSSLMDLNEFMESEDTEVAAEEADSDSAATMGKIVLPQNVDFTLNASFDEMLYDDLQITNTKGTIILRDGAAILNDLNLSTLGGEVNMNGSYASKPVNPEVSMDFGIKNMDIQSTAKAFNTIEKLAPIAKSCKGKFSTQMRLDCALDENMEPIEPTINGGGKVQTKGVYVEKFVPLTKVADELGIEQLSNPYIEDVNITYAFRDGRVFVDPFTIKLDGIPTTIEGSMSFSQELDYRMNMEVPVEKLPGQLGGQASSLLQDINNKLGSNMSVGTKIPVSIRITGNMDNPKVAGNYGEILQEAKEDIKEEIKEAVKEEVEEQIDNAKEEAVAKAREEADKIMADAQKEADALMASATQEADRLKAEAYEEAQKVEDSAKNVLEKAAKKLAADKIRQEADKAHTKALETAQKQADKILEEAQKKADAKIKEAENM